MQLVTPHIRGSELPGIEPGLTIQLAIGILEMLPQNSGNGANDHHDCNCNHKAIAWQEYVCKWPNVLDQFAHRARTVNTTVHARMSHPTLHYSS
jgi:hypothetical protein